MIGIQFQFSNSKAAVHVAVRPSVLVTVKLDDNNNIVIVYALLVHSPGWKWVNFSEKFSVHCVHVLCNISNNNNPYCFPLRMITQSWSS